MDWELYRTFEAIARTGSLSAAAAEMGVSQSTVSRRLDRLEESARSALVVRQGRARLTARGESLLAAIGPMADAAQGALVALDEQPELVGEVTVATVGEVVRWVLMRELASFYEEHPSLRLRILSDNRLHRLGAGEADVATRVTRPVNEQLVGKRLSVARYGFYAHESLPLGDETPWISTAGSLEGIADQVYASEAFADRPARLLLEDFEAVGRAVAHGLGVAVLPDNFARSLPGVRRVEPGRVGARVASAPPERELWLVVHRSRRRLAKVRAVMEWIERAFESGLEPRGASRP